jgi:hypothetical protein
MAHEPDPDYQIPQAIADTTAMRGCAWRDSGECPAADQGAGLEAARSSALSENGEQLAGALRPERRPARASGTCQGRNRLMVAGSRTSALATRGRKTKLPDLRAGPRRATSRNKLAWECSKSPRTLCLPY